MRKAGVLNWSDNEEEGDGIKTNRVKLLNSLAGAIPTASTTRENSTPRVLNFDLTDKLSNSSSADLIKELAGEALSNINHYLEILSL